MASDYGRNFGFRRSDETVRVSEGRFKTPATGSALLLGTAVSIDPATPGYLKACAANDPLVTGYSGLLLREEIHLPSIYQSSILDSYDIGVAKKDRLSVVTSGPGTKVWFQNTSSQTRADGRSIAGVSIVVTASTAVGDFLGWNGTAWAKTVTAVQQWMVVTAINATTGYVEAVLIK